MRNNLSEQKFGIGELLQTLPKPLAFAVMLLAGVLVSYYVTAITIVVLEGSTAMLLHLSSIAIIGAVLIPVTLIGLALKRTLLFCGIVSLLGLVYVLYCALHGSGPVLPWVRQSILYTVTPMTHVLTFEWLRRRYLSEPTRNLQG